MKRKLFTWLSPDHLQLRIDWSSFEGFLSCNRLSLYKLVYSRIPRPGPALTFGAAIHAALEIWYRNYPGHYPLPDTAQATINICRSAIDKTFSEHSGTSLTDWRTSEYAFECFLKYITDPSIRGEKVKPATYNTNQLIEFSFSRPIGEAVFDSSTFARYGYGTLSDNAEFEQAASGLLKLSFEWTGIIDLVADFDGEHWLVDHKTTSVLSGDFFDSFELAMQPIGYFAAARQALPDLNIRGFLVNVLACRKPTKTGTGFEALRRRYTYSGWQTNEWDEDVRIMLGEFLHNLQAFEFPKKTTWCAGKYGKCRYFDVCCNRPEVRLGILESGEFVDNEWKPVQ